MQSNSSVGQNDKSVNVMSKLELNTTMPKADRERVVLSLLAEVGEPLPPVLVYRILRVRGATFGRRSVMRYCSELGERGQLQKIDPVAMENGDLEQIDRSEKGYWMITDAGRERLAE